MGAGATGGDRRQLDGKVALITGAASATGRCVAQLFAEHGAAVVVVDIDDTDAGETAARIEKDGGRATAVRADLSLRTDCDAMVDAAVDIYGRLDVLFNIGAIPMPSRLVETTEEMWDATIATNVSATFRACRAAIPRMLEAGGAIITTTAPTLGSRSSADCTAYTAATAGLIALTRQIALEYGPKVRANVIAPGSIDTPSARDGAEDVARLARFLASDASASVSGAVIPCGGSVGSVGAVR